MTLTQLNYAVAVADSSSMSEAAKKIYIAQPSLSAAIRELEEELGTKLFCRSNRGIRLEDLEEYPCLSFEQGDNNSFYFSEEVMSTYGYRRLIKANDRATMLNLMVGLNAYTLCSGIISEELNGHGFCAVRLEGDEEMSIGYLVRRSVKRSALAEKYIEELAKYKNKVLG